MIRRLYIIMISIFIAGCSRGTVSEPIDGIETQAADPQSGAVIRVHITDDEIRSADRLTVNVVVEWPDSVSSRLIEPDWKATGWTVIQRTQQPTSTTQTGFAISISYLIEPFLPGNYAVPGFSVSIQPESELSNIVPESYEFESMPLPVQVLSVLDMQDVGELEPATGYLDPRAVLSEQQESNSLMFAIGILLLGITASIVWTMRRGTRKSESDESVFVLLEQVAKDTASSKIDSYNTLYQAFNRLDLQLQQTSEIRSMIEQCEQARFSKHPKNDLDPRTLALHTLELLGTTERVSA